jgi:hypothetical protein
LCLGCASAGQGGAGAALEYEIAYDDNRPSDAAALMSATFEQMVRFRPTGSYRALRFHAMLAQPGRVRWTVYAESALEQPEEVLATWERDYPAELAGGPGDGKWLVEDLASRVSGSRRGPIWIGFRRSSGDPRLWASMIDSQNAFVRDSDPARFLKPMAIRRTPMIRLDYTP